MLKQQWNSRNDCVFYILNKDTLIKIKREGNNKKEESNQKNIKI